MPLFGRLCVFLSSVDATYSLQKPIVGLSDDNLTPFTVPTGAVVEFPNASQRPGLIELNWKGQSVSVLLHDLADACHVADMGRIFSLKGS